MLLYVLESRGSSPGRQGFCMVVDAVGGMTGSIGGGIMEHKLVELARDRLKDPELQPDARLKKQVHDKTGENQSGMICSGEQTILLYPVRQDDASVVDRLLHSLASHQNGTLHLSPGGIGFDENPPAENFAYTYLSDSSWHYSEKTGYRSRLYIVGGGHCSLALSRLMRPLGFYITVTDDRPDLKTMTENEVAHEKITVADYHTLGEMIPGGPDTYIVIMTFGYRSDAMAMQALLHTHCRYLGVLGSKKKMEKLMAEFAAAGADPAVLASIHSPTGMAIHSQTPEEIAVSIAAEIIQVKNSGQRKEE